MTNESIVRNKRTLHLHPVPEEFGIGLKTVKKKKEDQVGDLLRALTIAAEEKEAETKKAEIKEAEAKEAETKKAEIKEAEANNADSKETEAARQEYANIDRTVQSTQEGQPGSGDSSDQKTSRWPVILVIFAAMFIVYLGSKSGSGSSSSRSTGSTTSSYPSSDAESSASSESENDRFNYYTTDRNSDAGQVFTDLTEIGDQEADFGDDLFITNIAPYSGNMVGNEQELLIVHWNGAWDNNVYWGIGSLEISSDNLRKKYYYEDSYETAEKLYEGWTDSNTGEYDSIETMEYAGQEFDVFQRTEDERVIIYAVQDRDGLGVLICELTVRLEENESAPDKQESFRKLMKSIAIQKDDFQSVVAASPLGTRAITSYEEDIKAVIRQDPDYETYLKQGFMHTEGAESPSGWYDHFFSHNYDMYGYADGNDYDTIGVHEYIDYQFDTKDSEAYFFEYAADDMADSENVSDVYVSDIETMEINGYEVKYLCKQYQYNNGNTQYPVEIISIGMSLNDTECLEIVDNRMNPKELGDVEEIVWRLAGECLEIQYV
ncbi:MAG: hypothetical protein IJ860_10450 [Eubacterium sp.]|nr:hypothetical protein [Eubacterium sp.]